jgi:RNA polymerase sigma factor (TIGR02999 family)
MNEEKPIERIDLDGTEAADELVPIVYEQLRRLAHSQLAKESPGQSLQTVDLVHEAYLRLVGSDQDWQGKGHFLAAAAEAMRRILVERARKKSRIKYGGRYARIELSDAAAKAESSPDEVITVSEMLDSLEKQHPLEAQIVKLHYFAGLSISEAGRAIGLPRTTAHRHWTFARAWLREAIREQVGESSAS